MTAQAPTRAVVTAIVDTLPVPAPSLLVAARQGQDFARFLSGIEALHVLEQAAPWRPLSLHRRITVAAFNAERLKHPGPTRRLLDQAGAAVALLTEVDVGMARSGNRHGPRILTASQGEGYLYGVEFVELDLGDAQEMRDHAGERNAEGFHGNAILSGVRLTEPHLIPIEEAGLWFRGQEGAQRRVGGRMALAARLGDTPLWVVSVHLESKTDAADRAAQMRRLFDALERIAPGSPCIIGGDLNTKDLPHEEWGWFAAPQVHEPLFALAVEAGFAWTTANVPAPTQRTGPSGDPSPPFRKLDWLLVRGVTAENPRVVAAIDEAGRAISDHEMIVVDILL